MATRIGCDNLVYAELDKDSQESLDYKDIKPLPGVMTLNINPNASVDTIFYDDGPGETATTLGNVDVEIEKNELTTEQKAALLGHKVDDKGAILYGVNDVPPWVAIGFRTLKSNGTYRYVWLYKGKFHEPEDNNQTKGDSIEFQSETINGQFVMTDHEFDMGDRKIRPWKYEVDEESDAADETLISSWFDEVKQPVPATE